MKKIILLSVLFLFISNAMIFAKQHGKASYYSKKLQGRHTSDGGKYHPDSLTCAHLTYPFGTILKVRNPKNDREVIVKVTDRGPHSRRLIIDLSFSAAEVLDIVRAGIATVEITKLDSMPMKYLTLLPLPIPTPCINVKNSPVANTKGKLKTNIDTLTLAAQGRY